MDRIIHFIDLNQRRLLIILLVLTSISFYLTLFYPYQGEEGIYTLQSYEMWFHHKYLIAIEFGRAYTRPPLYNWLIIALSNLLGWDNMLQASRMIAATATLSAGALLYQFTKRLFDNTDFATFTVLIYFSGDFLFRRGWLAYSDPLFSLWVGIAICTIWLAIRENRIGFVISANLALIAGVLTKAFIIYIFYALTVMILSLSYRKISFFLKPKVIFIHLTALFTLCLWFYFVPSPNHGLGMINDILRQYKNSHLTAYLQLFITKPFDLVVHLIPFSFVALASILLSKDREMQERSLDQKSIYHCLWIFSICYLPFWFSTIATPMRYVLPIYFLLAIFIAATIWRSHRSIIRIAIFLMMINIIVKFAVSFAGGNLVPKYHIEFEDIANDIVTYTQSAPIYTTDVSFTGYNIAAYIDRLIYPSQPITWVPPSLDNGFIITKNFLPERPHLIKSYIPSHMDRLIYPSQPITWTPLSFENGFKIMKNFQRRHLVKSYPAEHGNTIYLLCVGNACNNTHSN